jgi:hypothetical protein
VTEFVRDRHRAARTQVECTLFYDEEPSWWRRPSIDVDTKSSECGRSLTISLGAAQQDHSHACGVSVGEGAATKSDQRCEDGALGRSGLVAFEEPAGNCGRFPLHPVIVAPKYFTNVTSAFQSFFILPTHIPRRRSRDAGACFAMRR